MTIREPAVAGQFYPGTAKAVATALDRLLPAAPIQRRAKAIIAPHAGWMYSGPTAGIVYGNVEIPDRVVLIGPNHRGLGSRYAVFAEGSWRLPSGMIPVAQDVTAALLAECHQLTADERAHQLEHSLEVQVPFLQRLNPRVRIAPVLIGGSWPEAGGRGELRRIGEALANVVTRLAEPVLLVASTDLNHYESQATSNAKDRRALDAVVGLDEDELMRRVTAEEISMCGVAPTYIALIAAKKLGATRAEVLDYRTSGDVSGDFQRVVGYGAVVIE